MTAPPLPPARTTSRFVDRATIGAFLMALCAPFVDLWARPGEVREPQSREARNAAPLPSLEASIDSVTKFPEAFEEHFLDTFGLRDQLIRGHSLVYYYGLGVSPRPLAALGEDGWMFSTVDHALDYQRGARPLSADELERWQRLLENQRDLLARRGIEYLFAVVPSKLSAYEDKLPPAFDRVGPSRLDQLFDHLRAHSTVPCLDLRPAIHDERKHDAPDDYTYFKLGYHWYGRGAYRGYAELVRELAKKFPVLAPLPLEQCTVVDGLEDSLAQQAYIGDLLPQSRACYAPAAPRARLHAQSVWWKLHTLRSTVDDPALPRVLMLHDSMFGYIESLFAEHCQQLTTCWSHEFDISSVDTDKPDVVVVLYVEHVLEHPPPKPVMLPRELGEAFDAAPKKLLTLDMERASTLLGREGDTQFAPFRDDRGPGVVVTTTSVTDFVLLPPFEVPPDGHVIVELEIDSPAATMFALWCKRPGDARYRRDTRIRRDVALGPNRLLVELWEPDIDGRLRLRPGLTPGGYVIRSVEVRAP